MSFMAFLKKEIMEILKTTKIIILPALFLFFGILSPLSAKYMNRILLMAAEQQGIKIQLPDLTFIQSYEQFFKNLYFMMIVVTILVFAGAIAEEKSKGTAILVLTKCLSRTGFIAGKLIAAVSLFTLSYAVSTAICVYYTALLFPEYMNTGVLGALLLFWIFGILMITLTLLSSLLCKSLTAAAVGGFISYAVVSAIAALPQIGKYTPGALQTLSVELSRGDKTFTDAVPAAVIAIVISAAAVITGLLVFNKQEI